MGYQTFIRFFKCGIDEHTRKVLHDKVKESRVLEGIEETHNAGMVMRHHRVALSSSVSELYDMDNKMVRESCEDGSDKRGAPGSSGS